MWMSRVWMDESLQREERLKAMRYWSRPSVMNSRGILPAMSLTVPSRRTAVYFSLVDDMSHARMNLVARSMTATIYDSLPRTFWCF